MTRAGLSHCRNQGRSSTLSTARTIRTLGCCIPKAGVTRIWGIDRAARPRGTCGCEPVLPDVGVGAIGSTRQVVHGEATWLV